MAEAQPYYGQRYHGSEFLSAPQLLMFPRSPCSTNWLFLYHSMDSSLRRAFLPLPRWFSLAACQPAVSGSDEVKTWWYTVTTGIINKWRLLLECGKYGQSNRKLSTFQPRHIALFTILWGIWWEYFQWCLKESRDRGKKVGIGWLFSYAPKNCEQC